MEGNVDMTGAQAIVKALETEGVSLVYGYPGAAVCPFFDALAGSSQIKFILARQEQNAGHAASGYARISGRPGVCAVTSGPGATNLITALATAYMDSIPIIAITGQVRSDLIGRDVFQEADITGAAEPFCKHSYLVKKAADLPRIFKEAFYIASTGRPGPVLIDIPVDIQLDSLDFAYPETISIKGYKPSFKGHVIQIKRAAEAVSGAKRPVICAGGGVFSSDARRALLEFAEKCGIPIVTTMMGIGAVPTAHPLNLGMLGTYGKKSANRAIREADLLIIAGARVGDRAMAAPDQVAAHVRVVHIDIDPAEIGKNIETEIPIVGDLKVVLEALALKSQPGGTAGWLDYLGGLKEKSSGCRIQKSEYIEPRAFIRMLSLKMNDNSVLVSDVGQSQIWAANNFEIRQNRFLTSGGMGTMGYSIPAAIGVLTSRPELQTVAVCGDGAFQMSGTELGTIAQHGVKLKIVIMRNNRLGMVRELQDKLYNKNHVATVLEGNPDFISFAAAYGIKGAVIRSDDEAPGAVDKMLRHDGPYLLECAVDPAESSM